MDETELKGDLREEVQDKAGRGRWTRIGVWALAISVLFHLGVFVSVTGLADWEQPTNPEKSVEVELVPPPAEAEEPAKTEKSPEAAKKPEEPDWSKLNDKQKPDFKKAQQGIVDQQAAASPATSALEQAKKDEQTKAQKAEEDAKKAAEEAAKQAEAKAAEEQAAAKQAAEEQAAAEKAAAAQAAAAQGAAKRAALAQAQQILQPVTEFGDKDRGPRLSPEGSSATDKGEADKPDETGSASSGDKAPDETASAKEQAEASSQDTDTASDADKAADDEAAPEVLASSNGSGDMVVPMPAPKGPALAAYQAEHGQGSGGSGSGSETGKGGMRDARTLFSRSILGGARAQTAIAGMPEEQRVNILCMTELKAQLLNHHPAYPPQMLPSFRPTPGALILEPRQAAFMSGGNWYNLAFRCEVDSRARRVTRFRYDIGSAIPRSQWAARGFPAF